MNIDYINSILELIATMLGLLGCFGITAYIIRKSKLKASKGSVVNESEGNTVNMNGSSFDSKGSAVSIIGNNNTVIKEESKPTSGDELSPKNFNIKVTCQILFIDDEPLPTLIRTLKKAGWKNIKRIGDTANLDMAEILNANIIFVDIKGVGKLLQFKNEGVGLAAAIKQRYPKKGVVIYSATSDHNLFDPDLNIVDGKLYKNAEPIQFNNMIEQYGIPKD